MSAVIKGFPVGSAPTIGALTVKDYATPPDGAEDLLTLRQNTVALPDNPESFEITSAPPLGRYHVRSDGLLGVDLTDVQTADELTLEYNDTTGGGSVPKTFLFKPQQGKERFGWGKGRHYMLPKDAQDKVIWEPVPINRRDMHVSTSGLSIADIETREGENMTAQKLKDQVATVGTDIPQANGVLKYGEIPELAIQEEPAKLVWRILAEQEGPGCWQLLFKAGERFTAWSGGGGREMRGLSPIHPMRIGTYGGDEVATLTNLPSYDNCILQGKFRILSPVKEPGKQFYLFEDVDFARQPAFVTGKVTQKFVTGRRYTCYDIYPRTPDPNNKNPAIWDVKAPHEVGTYLSGFNGVLIEDSFQDLIGWAPDYDYAADITKPYPVNQFSHCLYIDGGNADITVRRSGYSRGSLTVYQMRSGGLWYDNFSMGSNQQMSVGPGKNGDDIKGYNGNHAYFLDSTFTWAGAKREDIDYMNASLGIRSQSWHISLRNCLLMHKGEPPVFAVDRAWPSVQPDGAYNFNGGSMFLNDLLVYKWTDNPDENIDGLDTATLDATTIEAYNDQWKSVTGSHRNDLIANLRALDEPWVQAMDINAWFLAQTDRAKPTRTDAQTMVFEPFFTGETPGTRWDIRLDWSTFTLPGIVPGDSVDLNGYHVNNFDTPDHPLVDLSLGGGALTHCGGRLDLTGDILDGGEITLDGAGQLFMEGGAVHFGVDMNVGMGARLANTGALTFNGDLRASGTSEVLFGIDAGDTFEMNGDLTLSGQVRVGFDGTGGTASLTLGAGAITTFEHVYRMRVTRDDGEFAKGSGEPFLGDTVTGLTSGFTGVIEHIETLSDDDEMYFHIRPLSGVPVNDEVIEGMRWFGRPLGFNSATNRSNIAKIISVPKVILPKIRSFTSGLHGLADPAITSMVTLGGTLVVDETNLPPGTYTLIEADTITGAFASQPANVAVTGTTVRLIVN